MDDLTLMLAVLYGVTFAAMFALHTWRRLAAGAALAAAAVAIHFALGSSASGDAGVAVFVFGIVAAIGFASGAAARIAALALHRRFESRAAAAAVGLLFLLGVPLGIHLWGRTEQRESQRRYAPPSLACKMRLHEARLGDRTVRLPLVWGVTLYTGPSPSGSINFYIQEQAREFCESTAQGRPRLTVVRIDLPQLESAAESRQPVCRAPRDEAWWPALCRHRPPQPVDLYSIALFDPARFDSERFLSFAPEPAGADRLVYDSRWRKDGPFMRAAAGHETYWRGPPRPGAASPYLARCYEDRNSQGVPNGLRCRAGYRLSPGVALVYDFHVHGSEFVAEALRQDERVLAIARSLLAR